MSLSSYFRNRAFLKGGGDILREAFPGGAVCRRHLCLSAEDCLQLLEMHRRCLREENAVKRDRKRNITRISLNGISYIVKDFLPSWRPEFLLPARKSWLGSHELDGFTAPALAWIHSPRQGDFMIFLDGGSGNFYQGSYLQRPDVASLYHEAGALLGELHAKGLYHADTKPSNFIFNELIPSIPRKILLVDCDKVLVYSSGLPEKKQLKNLAQFIGGSRNITDLQQWQCLHQAFYEGYCRIRQWNPSQQQNFMRKLILSLRNPSLKIENYLSEKHYDALIDLSALPRGQIDEG